MHVVPVHSSGTQSQAYNYLPSLRSASPGTGCNSPTHSQTTNDHPPLDDSDDACVEITPDNNHIQAESGFPNWCCSYLCNVTD